MVEDSDKLKKIDAKEILKKIENCEPIEYDNVIIDGNLDLNDLHLDEGQNDMIVRNDQGNNAEFLNFYIYAEKLKIIASSIKITNSLFTNICDFKYGKFESEVNLSNSIFKDQVRCVGSNFRNLNLSGTTFKKDIDFRFCCFSDNTIFKDATFDGLANFKWSAFLEEASFEKAKFNGGSNFLGAYFSEPRFLGAFFDKTTSFKNARFMQICYFGIKGNYNDKVIFNGKVDFEGVEFNHYSFFIAAIFNDSANFEHANFKEDADFESTKFRKRTEFSDAKFLKNAYFYGAIFDQEVSFKSAEFSGFAEFIHAKFGGVADFMGVQFKQLISFNGYKDMFSIIVNKFFWLLAFCGLIDEETKALSDARTIFNGIANFSGASFNNADFSGTIFCRECSLFNANNVEDFNFIDTIFKHHPSEEKSCRMAKRRCEAEGDKEEADRYFYREMAAKRKQKHIYIRYPEFVLAQFILGYGVHPKRLMLVWLVIIFAFGILYWTKNGANGLEALPEDLKFSFAIATAPGFIASIINSKNTDLPHLYQVAAIAETIIGTFLWACFIATISRKYMR